MVQWQKILPANAVDTGDSSSIQESGISPWRRNGNPCLENDMEREAWLVKVHGGNKKSDATEHI